MLRPAAEEKCDFKQQEMAQQIYKDPAASSTSHDSALY